MALDFPNSPVNGQTFSSGDFTWTWQDPPKAWICKGGGGIGGGGIGSVSEDTNPSLGGDLELNGFTIIGLTKADVGLPYVDNTSDLNKPISMATQTALNTKAPLVHTHPQSDITNLTADLALKAPLTSPALTGTPTAPTPGAGDSSTRLATTAFVFANAGNVSGPVASLTGAVPVFADAGGKRLTDSGKIPGAANGIATLDGTGKVPPAQDRVLSVATRQGDVVLTKTDVGLANVDNTSDLNKPVSTATQAALATKADVNHTHTGLVPTGTVLDFAGAAAPIGYLLCDGAAVSRSTYAALFAVVGSVFGPGDGSLTFNVPDLRGRTAIGTGSGTGLTARALGAALGEENHQLSAAEMPAHTHSYTYAFLQGAGSPLESGDNYTVGNSLQNTGSTGGGGGHNTMQPSLALTKIIKT